MKPDVTTKLLLAAIAGGLWALALRPTLSPMPASAAPVPVDNSQGPAVVAGERGLYIIENGKVYRFVETLGKPVAIGEYGPGVKARD